MRRMIYGLLICLVAACGGSQAQESGSDLTVGSTTPIQTGTDTTAAQSPQPTTSVPADTTTVSGAATGDSEPGSISFRQSFEGPTQTSLFSATGRAIDDGLLCSHATGVFVGNEDEVGNALTEQENDALYAGDEPFMAVTVEEMICDDGSGEFIFRIFTLLDPTDPDFAPQGTTWIITGETGYESSSGEGESSLPEMMGDGVFVWTGSGTINNQAEG